MTPVATFTAGIFTFLLPIRASNVRYMSLFCISGTLVREVFILYLPPNRYDIIWSLLITLSPLNVAPSPCETNPLPYLNSGITVTTAFFFMYFSGNIPLIVAGTCPPCVSSGFGVTVKLLDDNAPILEQDVDIANKQQADRVRIRFFCIV